MFLNKILRLIRTFPIKRGKAFLIGIVIKFSPNLAHTTLKINDSSIKINLNDKSSLGRWLAKNPIDIECEVFELLFKIIEWSDVFWDVGANIGIYTLSLADKCKVISFEPNRELFINLSQAVINRSNVKVYDYAITERDEEVILNIYKNSSDLSSLRKLSNSRKMNVRGRSIDNLIDNDNLNAPTILKIDVEGFEYFVLKGYSKLNIHKPIVIFEYSESFVKDYNINLKSILNLFDSSYNFYRIEKDGCLRDDNLLIPKTTNNLIGIHSDDERNELIEKLKYGG